MLEFYDSSVNFVEFMQQTEEYLRFTLKQITAKFPQISYTLPQNFLKLTVAEAFKKYCNLELIDLDPDLGKKCHKKNLGSVKTDDDFETAFFKILIEVIEPHLKKEHGVILYDYPASQAALAKVEGKVAKRFEFYLDGIELCNAFYELTDSQENRTRVKDSNRLRKSLGKEITLEDEEFYTSLEQGIPACCGNALGFDRWLALLTQKNNLHFK
jgi:elongation factor P--(R)-beta-lysine ligase